MSPHDGFDRPSRRNRGAIGHWIPLILTVAVATVGFAAWVWSERDDDDEEDDPRRRRHDDASLAGAPPPVYGELRPGEHGYGTTGRNAEESSSYMTRMSGALRRTPSPQQFFEGATRTVSAGITAAGAVVGSALSSIREEDKNAYKDHKTWSEEAEARRISPKIAPTKPAIKAVDQKPAASTGKKIKVAVVVSADADLDGVDDGLDYSQTHAVRPYATQSLQTISNSAAVYLVLPPAKYRLLSHPAVRSHLFT